MAGTFLPAAGRPGFPGLSHPGCRRLAAASV